MVLVDDRLTANHGLQQGITLVTVIYRGRLWLYGLVDGHLNQ